jgi:hypothetical protein
MHWRFAEMRGKPAVTFETRNFYSARSVLSIAACTLMIVAMIVYVVFTCVFWVADLNQRTLIEILHSEWHFVIGLSHRIW